VNLVGEHPHAVPEADVVEPFKLAGRPHPAHGVVGVAEHEQAGARVGGLALEVVVVHGEAPAVVSQRVLKHLAAVVAHGREEAVVHRRLQNHPVARLAEGLDHHRHRRHHARSIENPVALQAPAVAPRKPIHHGIVVSLGHLHVAEDTVLHPAAQRVDDGRGRAEVHVGHPHGQHVAARGRVPLVGVGAAAAYKFVKIVTIHTFTHYIIIAVRHCKASARPGEGRFHALTERGMAPAKVHIFRETASTAFTDGATRMAVFVRFLF